MNKELKERYVETVVAESWGGSEKWKKYYRGEIARVFETEKGYLIALEKPSIKKHFCFGYSDNRYDTEDYDCANDMAAHAAKSEEYFMAENLKQVDEWIESLEDSGYRAYTRVMYYKAPKDSVIRSLVFEHAWQKPDEGFEILSDADRAGLIEEFKELRKDFEKRLRSYLKRYGMAHVKTWSYWRDE